MLVRTGEDHKPGEELSATDWPHAFLQGSDHLPQQLTFDTPEGVQGEDQE